MQAALRRQLPPRPALIALENWGEELLRLPAGALSVEKMAESWGNLQFLLVECGAEGSAGEDNEHIFAMAWQRVRRSTEQVFQSLLSRPELASLYADLHSEILPLLADAVSRPREGRIIRCLEATAHLHTLARRTSGMPHAWLLARMAEMQYPAFTAGGWHGRMGSGFTWRRARALTQALIDCVQEHGLGELPLVVGFDSRVHADLLASLVTEVATASGQQVYLCSRDAPAPALVTYLTHTLGITNSAGLVLCTASRLPVKEGGADLYMGTEYQGIRYFTPYGMPAPAPFNMQVERLALTQLLDERAQSHPALPGTVRMIDPFSETVSRLMAHLGTPVQLGDFGSEPALAAVQRFWRRPEARIVIDEMHGASRGYLRAVCDELKLPCEILHGSRNPLLGDLPAANPEPPQLADLMARVRELREECHPLIGLALDADGDRLGVVDETGAYLPGNALLALLTDFLLNEAYPGEAGVVIRDFTATRLLDRLVALPEYAGRTLPPRNPGQLPAYMRAPGYRQLTGNPAHLHGSGVQVAAMSSEDFRGAGEMETLLARVRQGELSAPAAQEAFFTGLEHWLIAGDAQGGIITHGFSPDKDGVWAALLVLMLCAVRQTPLGELWRDLRQRVGSACTERLRLSVPPAITLPLVNRYIQHYEQAGKGPFSGRFKIGGCQVDYAGGVEDRFIEWAVLNPENEPAYLVLQVSATDPTIQVIAEGRERETTRRLLLAVAERVEDLIMEQLRHAENAWRVVETLASVQLPPVALTALPGTLNCRIAQQAYARLQELAHPGREAPVLLQFVTDRLAELQPEKSRVIAACRLGEQTGEKRILPPPNIYWEGEEER